MFKYDYDKALHTVTCQYSHRLDTIISNELYPIVTQVIMSHMEFESDRKLTVVFDFEKVEFVTSAFIRLCITIAKKVGEDHFSIVKTNPQIKKTFKIAGLDEQLNMD